MALQFLPAVCMPLTTSHVTCPLDMWNYAMIALLVRIGDIITGLYQQRVEYIISVS